MQYKIGGGNVIPSQMLKGVLEGCILKIISENETYGYEIVEKCKSYGLFDLSEGTIYPLLLRLERNALIQADYKESPVGPKRKYLSITEKGRIEMEQFYGSWRELSRAIGMLFQTEETTHVSEKKGTESGKQYVG